MNSRSSSPRSCSGAGKGLFDGFSRSMELEHLGVRQSPFATFVDYAVKD
jgi:hypothetical protein